MSSSNRWSTRPLPFDEADSPQFTWANLPGYLIEALVDGSDLDIQGAPEALRSWHGAQPGEEFVQRYWELLRERWLARDADTRKALVERLWNLAALRTGEILDLMEVMAPDVVLVADGGGLVPAARVPIHGADEVAKLLARAERVTGGFTTTPVWLNGAPAARIEVDGQLIAVSVVVENGLVTRIYAVANPQKLTRLDEPAELVR